MIALTYMRGNMTLKAKARREAPSKYLNFAESWRDTENVRKRNEMKLIGWDMLVPVYRKKVSKVRTQE